jgi:hypothetical protein
LGFPKPSVIAGGAIVSHEKNQINLTSDTQQLVPVPLVRQVFTDANLVLTPLPTA